MSTRHERRRKAKANQLERTIRIATCERIKTRVAWNAAIVEANMAERKPRAREFSVTSSPEMCRKSGASKECGHWKDRVQIADKRLKRFSDI
jgi:hypothetical protein